MPIRGIYSYERPGPTALILSGVVLRLSEAP